MMKNITLTLDDVTYGLVEHKAITLDLSVSEVIAEHLRQWAVQEDVRDQARRSMSDLFNDQNWRFAVGTADDREQRNARA